MRKVFSKEFKLEVVRELHSGKTPAQVARERSLKLDLVSRWGREYDKNPSYAFNGKGKASREETKTAELQRTIGELYLEVGFLKRVNKNFQEHLASLKKTR